MHKQVPSCGSAIHRHRHIHARLSAGYGARREEPSMQGIGTLQGPCQAATFRVHLIEMLTLTKSSLGFTAMQKKWVKISILICQSKSAMKSAIKNIEPQYV